MNNERNKKSHGDLSKTEIGLVFGLVFGVIFGIPTLLVFFYYLYKFCARKQRIPSREADIELGMRRYNKVIEDLLKSSEEADRQFCMHFPDAELREKLVRGIFHDDVLEAFGNLSKDSREFIVEWMKIKHGPTKANELPLIALNP